jgi:signal transduction histidine kinase
VLLALLMIAGLDVLVRTEPPERLWRIVSAERALARADGPDAASFVPVALPDDAPWIAGEKRQRAYYRLRFDLPADEPALWAILIRKPFAAVKVWVNGELLADAGVERTTLPEYRHDLRYNLSPGLLRQGSNEILILSVSQTWHAGLAEVWLGDSAELARYKAQRNRVEKDFPRIALQVIAVLAVILGGVFLVRRQEPAFGWFAGALLLWALHTQLTLRGSALFDSPEFSRPLAAVTLAWFVVLGMVFVHRLLAIEGRRRERRVALAMTLATLLIYLPSLGNRPELFHAFVYGVYVPLVLVVGALIAQTLYLAQRSGQPEARWLLTLASALLVIGIRDWLRDLGWLGGPDSLRYLPFAAPWVFAVFGAMLLRRHAAALTAAEQTNADLEAKVRAKTAEIERNWQHIAVIERERARFEERDRLMRDMHDGVGGHLVQALSMVQAGQSGERIAEAVQAALDDLRLLIDASDIHSEGLSDVLARFRERLQRRLAALGISLDWDFTSMPALPLLHPDRSVDVLRILQEWFTNSIKHAQARRIALTCLRLPAPGGHQPDQLLFEYRDDGCGLPLTQGRGRGLASIEHRARRLGGQLQLISGASGFAARLCFPLQADET